MTTSKVTTIPAALPRAPPPAPPPSVGTGKLTTIALIHRPVSFGLSLSPDERYILYTQVDQGGSDLMLVENFR